MLATKNYNPKFLTDEQLLASFCVRQREFESITRTLRENNGASNQHLIVFGPRGSGKTTLLLRAAIEVQQDKALSQCLFPILFAEESYEISSCGEFWLECLFHLTDQAPSGNDDLRQAYEHFKTETNDKTLADNCRNTLLDFADHQGQRLLLVVENLNMLFNDINDDDIGWQLRHTLQTEPRIMLIASATNRFDAIDNDDKAFYELFKEIKLSPLMKEDCHTLWQTITGQSPSNDKIRVLQILTGGSPRLLTIVARFGAALSLEALMQDLLDLVDEHTEYFKSHLEALAHQERRVYLALADLWAPATARTVAERARLPINTCSTQLNRLCQRGIVAVTERTPKRKHYYLTERMYNIYYLLRRRRQPSKLLKALIEFMAAFYGKEEFSHIITQAFAVLSSAFNREDLKEQLNQLGIDTAFTYRDTTESAWQQQQASILQATSQRTLAIAPPQADNTSPAMTKQDSLQEAQVFLQKSGTLLEQQRLPEALQVLDVLLERFGDSDSPKLQELVAKALFNKSGILKAQQRPQEALQALDVLLERFGDSDSLPLQEPVAMALFNKGNMLLKQQRLPEALQALDVLLERFGDSDSPPLQEPVAKALVNKSGMLLEQQRLPEALQALDVLLERFGDSDSPKLQELVAMALFNKGNMLLKQQRLPEALQALDALLERFGDSDSPPLQEPVAKALVNKSGMLLEQQRLPEALQVLDALLERFGDSDSPPLQEPVAKALFNKGNMLLKQQRLPEALQVLDALLERFGDSDSPPLQEPVAKALVNKSGMLLEQQRLPEALQVLDALLERFGDSDSPPLLEEVAKVLLLKSSMKLGHHHYEAAIDTVTGLLEKHPEPAPWHAFLFAARARAYLAIGNQLACVADINACLAGSDKFTIDIKSVDIIGILIDFAARFGAQAALDLIEAQPPTADSSWGQRLAPLVAALQLELGEHLRIAVEVAEIAGDIRQAIEKCRQQWQDHPLAGANHASKAIDSTGPT